MSNVIPRLCVSSDCLSVTAFLEGTKDCKIEFSTAAEALDYLWFDGSSLSMMVFKDISSCFEELSYTAPKWPGIKFVIYSDYELRIASTTINIFVILREIGEIVLN